MRTTLTTRGYLLSLLGYFLFALAVMVILPWLGSESLDRSVVLKEISKNSSEWSTDTFIFVHQRVPRVLLGFLAGGALAMVGSVFQVILRNPLAAPSSLGVTSGAALGAVLAISIPSFTWQIGVFSTVPILSLAGSLLVVGFIYLLSQRPEGMMMNTLLLTGITLNLVCGAVIPLIKYLSHPHLMIAMDRWMMGGLDSLGYQSLPLLLPLLIPGIGLLLIQMPSLNHLALGTEMASGHGVDVSSVQKVCFLAGSLVTAGVVSIAGPIYFVGLIVPHMVRRLSGYDHRIILPAAFLGGGAFLVLCDGLARTLIAPTEMPVGIITAILGGSLFLYLLVKNR